MTGSTTAPEPRLVAALRAAGVRDVDGSRLRRAEYATDASNYRVLPRAVVFPHDADEVRAVLAVGREHGVPVTARGGGTSCAGNAIGHGIVLDFSVHMNRIVSIDPQARRAVVQPGVVLSQLQEAAAPHGLRFGPDPSTQSRCTLGGMIGNNACGSHSLVDGRTAEQVVRLSLLLADGAWFEATTLGCCPAPLGSELKDLVANNLELIRAEFGRFPRQVSGYSLEHLLPEHGESLARFLVGSEGTLGIVVEAEVALLRRPAFTALALLGYRDVVAAADAVPRLQESRAQTIEGMDRRLVDALVRVRGVAAVPPLPTGDAWLFVETAGESQEKALEAGRRVVELAGALDAAVICGDDAERVVRAREEGAGLGSRTPSGEPAWPGWEDAAVPPERLGAYLEEFNALSDRHGIDGLLYGHFGEGCVHVRLNFPLTHSPQRMRDFVVEAARLAGAHGGSVSGEHGDGRARTELLGMMFSPAALELLGSIKRLFDPIDLLNPGVVVGPLDLDADLRLPAARELPTPRGFSYREDGSFTAAVHRCVGVGKCRADNTAAGGVMCPSYLATRDETHSTRGRARVLQELANGSLVNGWDAPEVETALELCLSCKGCKSDCPAGVDMATYKAEVLHQRYRRRLRPRSHYALGWIPRWARLATRAPRLTQMLLRPRSLTRVLKHLAGVDPRRELPVFAPSSFRAWFATHAPATGDPVMLWVDTFTNAFTPEVGRAAVAVLEAAGYSVRIPAPEVCCGLTWISTGQLDGARRQLRRTLAALMPAVVEGIPIVGLEPSCTAVLRSELVELLSDEPGAVEVAKATVTLAELLQAREFTAPLQGITAVVQPHCHQHAVMGFSPEVKLFERCGANVQVLGGCCGMAGNFGFEQGHYEVSQAVASQTLLPAVRSAAPGTKIIADGFSCRTQLQQSAGQRGQHLAEVLAEAIDAPARAG